MLIERREPIGDASRDRAGYLGCQAARLVDCIARIIDESSLDLRPSRLEVGPLRCRDQ